jgi:hypothetical protein
VLKQDATDCGECGEKEREVVRRGRKKKTRRGAAADFYESASPQTSPGWEARATVGMHKLRIQNRKGSMVKDSNTANSLAVYPRPISGRSFCTVEIPG